MNFLQIMIIVENMYLQEVEDSDINSHCEKISDFLNACGYSVEEYHEKLTTINQN